MKNKLVLISAFATASLLSSAAMAHGWDRDEWRGHHHQGWYAPLPPVAYVAPQPVYFPQPAFYSQQVVYAPAPVGYAPPPVYYATGNRIAGQVVGAVAGGVIGNAVGHGGFGPTAIGAVLGGVVGGSLAE
jgi:hypothetical protein